MYNNNDYHEEIKKFHDELQNHQMAYGEVGEKSPARKLLEIRDEFIAERLGEINQALKVKESNYQEVFMFLVATRRLIK